MISMKKTMDYHNRCPIDHRFVRGKSLTTTFFGESTPKFVKLELENIGVPNGRSPQFGTLPIPKLPAILSSSEGNPPGWSCPDTRICLAGLVPNPDGQIVGENKRLRLFYGALPELEELVRPANRLDPSEKYAGKIQGAF